MRGLALSCLIAGTIVSPAAAQWVWQEGAREGQIKPITSYPVGNPDAIGRQAWAAMRLARRGDLCRKFGCLIIVNDSATYRLQEFNVRPIAPKSATDWGPNQIEEPLMPRQAAIRFKLADQRFCDWPVRFVLRHRKTREILPIETSARLCAEPDQYTVLRVRVVKPDVQIEQQ